jgi:hypothetical protein
MDRCLVPAPELDEAEPGLRCQDGQCWVEPIGHLEIRRRLLPGGEAAGMRSEQGLVALVVGDGGDVAVGVVGGVLVVRGGAAAERAKAPRVLRAPTATNSEPPSLVVTDCPQRVNGSQKVRCSKVRPTYALHLAQLALY